MMTSLQPVGRVGLLGPMARPILGVPLFQGTEIVPTVSLSQAVDTFLTQEMGRADSVVRRVNRRALRGKINRYVSAVKRRPQSFVVSMSGGTASGKSTLFSYWINHLNQDRPTPIAETILGDHYYKNLAKERAAMGDVRFFTETNLDHPQSLTLTRLAQVLEKLKSGKPAWSPVYSFADCTRNEQGELKQPRPLVFVESLFAMGTPRLRQAADMTLFVDASQDVRSVRWWQRAPQRGHSTDKTSSWSMFHRALAMHNRFVEPLKNLADIVLNGDASIEQLHGFAQRFSTVLTQHIVKTPLRMNDPQ